MGNTARRLLGAAFSASTLLGCGASNPDVLAVRADATTSTTTESTTTSSTTPETTISPTSTTIETGVGAIACAVASMQQTREIIAQLPYYLRFMTAAEELQNNDAAFLERMSLELENPSRSLYIGICDVLFEIQDIPVLDLETDQYITDPIHVSLTTTPEDLSGVEDNEALDCVAIGYFGDLDETGTVFIPGSYNGQSVAELLC